MNKSNQSENINDNMLFNNQNTTSTGEDPRKTEQAMLKKKSLFVLHPEKLTAETPKNRFGR